MIRSTLDIALDTLRDHPTWYLFPIKAGAKEPPLLEDNLACASNDPEQIKRWHAEHFGCNWGVSLKKSRLIVVDVDCKPGKCGRQTWRNLVELHGKTPATLIVRTPSGGFHCYYDQANGAQHACRLGVYGFGRDVDSPNYVLLAGCRIATGSYTVHRARPLAPSPAWFAVYLVKSNQAEPVEQTPAVELDTEDAAEWAIHHLTHDARSSVQGKNGEFALLMTAATLKDHAISRELAVELLHKHYNVPPPKPGERPHPYCDPLWGDDDGERADSLDQKVRNAWSYLKQTKPGAHTAQADFQNDVEDEGLAPVTDPRALLSPSAIKHRADLYVRYHYTVVNGKLYPKRGPTKGWRAKP